MTPDAIRAARLELGLTQAGLARLLGYSRYLAVLEWEAGRQRPSPSAQRLLALVLALRRAGLPDTPEGVEAWGKRAA